MSQKLQNTLRTKLRLKTCSLGHKHEEEVESCFGYYDEDDCMTDGVGMVDVHLKSEFVQCLLCVCTGEGIRNGTFFLFLYLVKFSTVIVE